MWTFPRPTIIKNNEISLHTLVSQWKYFLLACMKHIIYPQNICHPDEVGLTPSRWAVCRFDLNLGHVPQCVPYNQRARAGTSGHERARAGTSGHERVRAGTRRSQVFLRLASHSPIGTFSDVVAALEIQRLIRAQNITWNKLRWHYVMMTCLKVRNVTSRTECCSPCVSFCRNFQSARPDTPSNDAGIWNNDQALWWSASCIFP